MRSRDVLTTIGSPVPSITVLDQQQTINKVPHPKHVPYKPHVDRPCAKCSENKHSALPSGRLHSIGCKSEVVAAGHGAGRSPRNPDSDQQQRLVFVAEKLQRNSRFRELDAKWTTRRQIHDKYLLSQIYGGSCHLKLETPTLVTYVLRNVPRAYEELSLAMFP